MREYLPRSRGERVGRIEWDAHPISNRAATWSLARDLYVATEAERGQKGVLSPTGRMDAAGQLGFRAGVLGGS
jgi:hypothetical protein